MIRSTLKMRKGLKREVHRVMMGMKAGSKTRRQKTEDGRQKTVKRRQKTEDRRQRTMTAIEDVNKARGKPPHRQNGGARSEFAAKVDAFIEKYRLALKRLART